MYRARTAAVCANGSINHHYSTEPPSSCCFVYQRAYKQSSQLHFVKCFNGFYLSLKLYAVDLLKYESIVGLPKKLIPSLSTTHAPVGCPIRQPVGPRQTSLLLCSMHRVNSMIKRLAIYRPMPLLQRVCVIIWTCV